MKSMKLPIVMAVMAMAGFVMEAGAADVDAFSGAPSVFYHDTDYPVSGNEWRTYSNVTNTSTGAGLWELWDKKSNSYPIRIEAYTNTVPGIPHNNFAFLSKSNGEVCLADDALCIKRSANDFHSLYVDSNGNINLALGSILIDRSTSSVGIGIWPTEKVDVASHSDAARFQLTSFTNTANQAAQFIQRRARLSGGGGVDGFGLKNGDNIGLFSFRGYNGSGFTGSKAVISVAATEDWSTTKNGNMISLRHTPNGLKRMVTALQIKGHGDVYIPNGNLYVKGSKMNVPDYVFDKEYKLMPLDELKAFVQKNNHLPGVVSADEVDQAGVVNLSGLQMTLLEKVEELTLYTLQQDEALRKKDAEMKAAQVEMKVMKAQQNIQEAEIKELKSMKQKVAQLESILTNLALESSTSDKVKVSMK